MNTEKQPRYDFTAFGAIVDIVDIKMLRDHCEQLSVKLAPSVVLLGSKTRDGRSLLMCSVSKELTGLFHAGDIVRDVATVVGGSGGGRQDLAQGGSDSSLGLDEAVDRFYEFVERVPASYTQEASRELQTLGEQGARVEDLTDKIRALYKQVEGARVEDLTDKILALYPPAPKCPLYTIELDYSYYNGMDALEEKHYCTLVQGHEGPCKTS